MKTQVLTDARVAAEIVRAGGIVAFPTETVFGLGADATNPAAIEKLFWAKGRPTDNPLIVHVANRQKIFEIAICVSDSAALLLSAYSPGPITVVLPKNSVIIDKVTAGFNSVGVRVPDHPRALEFLRYADLPIAAPSANRSGKPSGTSVEAVLEDLDGRIDAILSGELSRVGVESTVVDCTQNPPYLLRPGAISLEQLQAVVPKIALAKDELTQGNSPGLKYAHYQPSARVRLFDSFSELPAEVNDACLCMEAPPAHLRQRLGFLKQFDSVEQYARDFYESLRQADRQGIVSVYCQRVPEVGIGRALADRMGRAAGK